MKSRKPSLTILKGLPASGKSTWAKEQAAKNSNIIIVSKDDIRETLLEKSGKKSVSENKVRSVRDMQITGLLAIGRDVIVDDTNLNPVNEPHLRSLFSNFADISVHSFYTSPEECVRRDKEREKKVGPAAIWGTYNKYVKGGKNE